MMTNTNTNTNTATRNIYVKGTQPTSSRTAMGVGVASIAVCESHSSKPSTYHYTVSGSGEDKPTVMLCTLEALLSALKLAKDGDVIHVAVEYIANGYSYGLDNWRAKGWRKTNKKRLAHTELWQQIDELRKTLPNAEVRHLKRSDTEGSAVLAELMASVITECC